MAYRSPYAALHGELDELLQSTRERRPYDPDAAVQQSAFYRDLEERWARDFRDARQLRTGAVLSPEPDRNSPTPAPPTALPADSPRKEP
jgi:hypothetical protein